MSNPTPTTGITIPGNAGHIEGMLTRAAHGTRRAAVLCHPHPQFGGSMHDGVLDTVEATFLAAGVDCVRFNFRGVGSSEGRFDGGKGETDDAMAVLGWARDNVPDSGELWLAGYSFGAHVAWRAGQATDDLDRIVLVAPPFGRMEFTGAAPNIPIHVVGGDNDDFIDWAVLDAWAAGQARGLKVTRLPGVDHFFRTGTSALATALQEAARASDD